MEVLVQLLMNSLNLGLSYVLMALGLTTIFSIMGIVNFAHGEIYMLGAFAAYVAAAQLKIGFPFDLFIAVLATGGLGFVIERFLFRRFRGEQLKGLVLSLGLSILIQNMAYVIWGGDDRSFAAPFRGISFDLLGSSIPMERMVMMGVSVSMLLLMYYFVVHTKTGQAMQAVAQDADAAALQGININRISMISFGVGCALAGLAGALMGPIFYISPFIGGLPVIKAFVVIVLGGLGSIFGALVGGLLLGAIDSISLYFLGTMGNMAGFVVLILIILFRPKGLFGYES